MSAIAELLRHHPELALFATLALGYFIGQLKLGGFSLGTVAANRGVLLGISSGAGTNTPALLAIQEAAGSKVPVLGYAVPYAIGNVLIIAWGPVLVNIVPKLSVLAN